MNLFELCDALFAWWSELLQAGTFEDEPALHIPSVGEDVHAAWREAGDALAEAMKVLEGGG